MPTELHDAWPESLSDTSRGESCPGPCPATVSARRADDDAPSLDLSEVQFLIEEMRREQSQRMTILTAIVALLMLSLMSQIETLKKEIRCMGAVPPRRY